MRPSWKKLAPALLLGSALLSAGSITAAAVPAGPAGSAAVAAASDAAGPADIAAASDAAGPADIAAASDAAAAVAVADTRTAIVDAANGEIGQGETPPGSNCNPYGPCEAWCAHFATWTWRQAGITIPNYGFTGDIYTWGRGKGRAHSTNTGMQPGDIVLYGTGPQNTSTSVHTGVVVAVGNGKITTVEGNANNAVRKFGPFDPTRASAAGRPGNINGWVAAQ